MARFYPVSPLLWRDPMVRAWDDATFRLASFFLTCPHRKMEGLYQVSIAYMAADIGWTERKARTNLEKLIADGFVEYDYDAEVVFVRRALKYLPPKSDRQIKGALNVLRELPPHSLGPALVQVAEEFAPEFAECLVNGSR